MSSLERKIPKKIEESDTVQGGYGDREKGGLMRGAVVLCPMGDGVTLGFLVFAQDPDAVPPDIKEHLEELEWPEVAAFLEQHPDMHYVGGEALTHIAFINADLVSMIARLHKNGFAIMYEGSPRKFCYT